MRELFTESIFIPFVDPQTHDALVKQDRILRNQRTGRKVATIIGTIPRFVEPSDNYAESFGWEWKHWADTQSDARNTGTAKRDLILERTHFQEYDLKGKSILECCMGGGDDSEGLLGLPFSEVHAFDLSTAVERARHYLDDPRLVISQASIDEIPYPDFSFDFVFCHRVLQFLPDPQRGLRRICKKVRPGGTLFVYSGKKSCANKMNYKNKYRWFTKRLPHRYIYWFVEKFGSRLHSINKRMYGKNIFFAAIAFSIVPFEFSRPYGSLDEAGLLEMEKLNTFDALTPKYDRPMSSKIFRRIIENEGFRIEHIYDPRIGPVYCTAVKL